jgi:hypothetical protein
VQDGQAEVPEVMRGERQINAGSLGQRFCVARKRSVVNGRIIRLLDISSCSCQAEPAFSGMASWRRRGPWSAASTMADIGRAAFDDLVFGSTVDARHWQVYSWGSARKILVEQAAGSPAVVKRAKVACYACPSPETAKATLALKIAAIEHHGGRVIARHST